MGFYRELDAGFLLADTFDFIFPEHKKIVLPL
jgi:hypothetical protein